MTIRWCYPFHNLIGLICWETNKSKIIHCNSLSNIKILPANLLYTSVQTHLNKSFLALHSCSQPFVAHVNCAPRVLQVQQLLPHRILSPGLKSHCHDLGISQGASVLRSHGESTGLEGLALLGCTSVCLSCLGICEHPGSWV